MYTVFNTTPGYIPFRILLELFQEKIQNFSIAILNNLSSKTFQVMENCIIKFHNYPKLSKTLMDPVTPRKYKHKFDKPLIPKSLAAWIGVLPTSLFNFETTVSAG